MTTLHLGCFDLYQSRGNVRELELISYLSIDVMFERNTNTMGNKTLIAFIAFR